MTDMTNSVASKILAYLNGELGEDDLIQWSEDSLVGIIESDEDIVNEDVLMDILGYIGAGDTPNFPLTWAMLSGFLDKLGVRVRIVAE